MVQKEKKDKVRKKGKADEGVLFYMRSWEQWW